jgi:5'-methylthioadenosine phosphorylase
MADCVLAVIGGTGLYAVEELEAIEEINIDTPYGNPSAPIVSGMIDNTRVLFLARHGRNHTLLPSEVNYRANIWALKELRATWCLSVSAVGSLKEEYQPGHVVVPDQFIDRTKHRPSTFFGDGVVAHVPFASPVCPVLSKLVLESAVNLAPLGDSAAHSGGTYLAMEGPLFSTRAESRMYRAWGANIIGMTNLPEAKLAREAEISYATAAMVTDYDCWRSESDDVDVSEIMQTLQANTALAKRIIVNVAKRVATLKQPEFISNALATAILTPKENISEAVKGRLNPILKKYL